MAEVYIKATSKKALNEKIAEGKPVEWVKYSMFEGDSCGYIQDLKDGTAIKIWEKRDFAGTPIAKSYGTWNKTKNKVM